MIARLPLASRKSSAASTLGPVLPGAFLSSSRGDISYGQAVRCAIPFIFLGIIGPIIVTYVPAFSVWLPHQVYQGL